MSRSSFGSLLLAAPMLAIACNGPELTVFDLPVLTMMPGTGGTSGAAGMPAVTSAGSAGAPRAGSSSGGAAAGSGGTPSEGGGSGGLLNTAGMPDGGGMEGTKCDDNADCMLGWQCEKRGCSEPTGECVPYPPFCVPNPAPVCGCDGVTYWNDCLRLRSGARLFALDPCRATACTCEVGTDCVVPPLTYASCSHLLPFGAMCGHGSGACWVLPPQCDPNLDFRRWLECKPPEPGESPACVDTCTAIASEHTYVELHRGDVCN
jgi:hypothetical protein